MFLIFLVGVILFVVLFKRVNVLEDKVHKLEGGIVVSPQPKPATPAPKMATMAEPAVQQTATPQPVAPRPAPQVIPPEPKPSQEGATEFAVGSKLLTGVGVLALILGVAFFLRYAFVNNLISEGMRIGLGVVFGLIIIGIGHFLRTKYEQYGHTLIGAGLGILYLTIYAAYSFYSLIGFGAAFVLLILITAGGVGLSLQYNSKPLVTYAFLGAYIMPFLLPLATSVHVLFIYLLILNVGVLLTARFKMWPEFTLGSLAGTCLLFIQWVYGPYNPSLFLPTMMYFTVIFFTFFITSLLNFVYRDRDYKGIDGILLYGIPTVYFLLMLTIVSGRQNVALLALCIGIFYIVLSCVIRAGFGQLGELKKFSNAMLCVAMVFIAAATALHFQGSTITIFWAIEAVLMVGMGYILNTPSNRIAGVALAGLTGIRAFIFDLGRPTGEAVFNSRSATLFFVVLAFFIIWRLYVSFISKQEGAKPDEIKSGRNISAFGLYAGLFFWVTLEAHDFMQSYELYIPIIWMILAAVMLSLGAIFKEKVLRVLSFVLILLAWFMELVFHSSLPAGSVFIINIRVGTVIIAILLCAYILWLFKTNQEGFSEEERKLSVTLLLLVNALALWAGSLEVVSYFNNQSRSGRDLENVKRVALSGFWLLYALVGLGVGIMRKSIFVRYASIILFGVTVFKIFLYDTANLDDVYRFVSFITLGIILLIAGFAYYKFKDRILEFVHAGDNENKVV